MRVKKIILAILLTTFIFRCNATQFSIYFAGALFNHKELIGNVALATQINQLSRNKYICNLPQDLEKDITRCIAIRNADISKIMECDLALFNFDGTELDSGTIVEYMVAKMLDIPAVIIRTDFRKAGDQVEQNEDPWNLMVSGYPRTKIVIENAMMLYKNYGSEGMRNILAKRIIEAFNEVLQEPSLLSAKDEIIAAYLNLRKMCGFTLSSNDREMISKIIEKKIEKRIY